MEEVDLLLIKILIEILILGERDLPHLLPLLVDYVLTLRKELRGGDGDDIGVAAAYGEDVFDLFEFL